MPHEARIRPETIKEVLTVRFRDIIALTVIVGLAVTINSWTYEPSIEEVNKQREVLNEQHGQELNDCMAGDVKVIVGLHNCRPLKNHKSAVIWGR